MKPLMKTKQQLADKFIEAGYGRIEIDDEDLLIVGISKVPKYAQKDWKCYCSWVYKKLTKQEIGSCHLKGRGFRSQWYSKQVAEAISQVEEVA